MLSGTVLWPQLLLPQHTILPVAFKPHVCAQPELIDTQSLFKSVTSFLSVN